MKIYYGEMIIYKPLLHKNFRCNSVISGRYLLLYYIKNHDAKTKYVKKGKKYIYSWNVKYIIYFVNQVKYGSKPIEEMEDERQNFN